MIPDKLYIPTSTLNFNNIMSSESISPAGFYAKRGFGYKRFEKVAPNNLDYRILLYDKCPDFSIDDKELENYPMIIEIDTKSVDEDIIQKYQSSIYFSEETIYLNPITTKIIFRNEREKKSTLSKVEMSIETKMFPLYKRCFCYEDEILKRFIWSENVEIQDASENYSLISKDRKINKLKGFLYAYILSANKSLPNEIVALKKYAKELRNILSAVITSPDEQPTYKQNEQLRYLYQLINDLFRKATDGFSTKRQEEIQKYGESILSFCKDYGLDFDNLFCTKHKIQSYKILEFYCPNDKKEEALNEYILRLEGYIYNLGNQRKKAKIQIENLPILSTSTIEHICGQTDFVPKLLNEYIAEAFNSTDFVQSRYDFAKAGGKIFKEEINEKWENSEPQKYINGLLKNLNEHSSFEIGSITNPTLESFAAFCQKGDSDIDKLEDYLISNEIGDFKIAFSLWGIVFGFADMPKTLTNDLFEADDADYTNKIYKYIFKQVHHINLEGYFEVQTDKGDKNPANNETSDTKQQSENYVDEELNRKLKPCNLNSEQLESINKWYRKNHYLINDKFFKDIKGERNGIGEKKLPQIKECLCPNEVQKQSQKTLDLASGDLFSKNEQDIADKKNKIFYLDDNAYKLLDEINFQSKEIKDKVVKNLKYIQKGYRPNGYYHNRKDNNDNKNVIDHFLKLMTSDKNKYSKLSNKELPNDLKEQMRKLFENKYN